MASAAGRVEGAAPPPVRDPAWVYLAPLWVYGAASSLKILPFSEWLVRLPSACAGVLNVVLMFVVAKEVFGGTRPAISRLACSCSRPRTSFRAALGPGNRISYVRARLAGLHGAIHQPEPFRDLWAASFCLGLGMYTYTAGLVILPVYFLVTLVLVRRHRAASGSTTALAAACAGFGLAFVPLAIWHLLHPEHLVGLAVYYTHGKYNKNLGWAGFFGANAISHIDAWWDCYRLDKLFFSGDPDVRF